MLPLNSLQCRKAVNDISQAGPQEMDFKLAWSLIKKTLNAWIEDSASSMGAALAYYAIFSIAPLLLIVIAVTGWVFGADAARGEIISQLQGTLGNESAAAIEEMIKSANKPGQGIVATLVGVFGLLLGATSIFSQLQDALDKIWRVPTKKEMGGVFKLIRARLLSFSLILGIAFLLMASLVISALISMLKLLLGPMLEEWEIYAQLINFFASFGLITVLFALIYKILPRSKVAWQDVWVGAAATSFLFTIGKLLIGLYIGKSSAASIFGAAGSLAVLLIWIYYSAQILLLGAEFTWVYAHAVGSRKGQQEGDPANPITT
ncbi:MAG TPA: YihY/virulence factor BrkB family protein [Dongiaceae bacterium]|nr:YihY/virulence factor BrkB family protein [Dongiaceae bacterium]